MAELSRDQEYYRKNKAKASLRNREYYKKNREKIRKQQREYYLKNKDDLQKYRSEHYYANWDHCRRVQKRYFQKYKDVVQAKRRERLRSNPIARIIKNLRSRLNSVIVGKSKRTMSLVGCDKRHLFRHIEVQFKGEMSWDNYGKVWHLDHHIPIDAFNPDNDREWEACWHFSNLKPMLSKDNLRKGNKICLER